MHENFLVRVTSMLSRAPPLCDIVLQTHELTSRVIAFVMMLMIMTMIACINTHYITVIAITVGGKNGWPMQAGQTGGELVCERSRRFGSMQRLRLVCSAWFLLWPGREYAWTFVPCPVSQVTWRTWTSRRHGALACIAWLPTRLCDRVIVDDNHQRGTEN
jgi:hypothetical protein